MTAKGYVLIRVPACERSQHSVRKDGWMLEHRYVMERLLGRLLDADEDVDHEDEDKQHNTPENLRVKLHGDHAADHHHARFG